MEAVDIVNVVAWKLSSLQFVGEDAALGVVRCDDEGFLALEVVLAHDVDDGVDFLCVLITRGARW